MTTAFDDLLSVITDKALNRDCLGRVELLAVLASSDDELLDVIAAASRDYVKLGLRPHGDEQQRRAPLRQGTANTGNDISLARYSFRCGRSMASDPQRRGHPLVSEVVDP
jgi:hypothetical protein